MNNLIVLHGWASKPKNWDKFKQVFDKNNLNIYIPQLPGFKKELKRPWTLDDYCLWLNNYIEHQKIDNVILLGHSFGGRIAVSFCSLYPDKVKKLILVNSAGIVENSLKKVIFQYLAKIGGYLFSLPLLVSLKKSARWLLYKLAREKDYYQASEVMKKTMQLIINFDLRNDAEKIEIPVLLIWGREDKLTPLRYGRIFADKISNSVLKVFSGQGHGLPVKNPHLIKKDILSFINKK